MTNTKTTETGPGRVYLYPGDDGHECGRACPSGGSCPYYIDWYYQGGAQELEEAERQAEEDWDGCGDGDELVVYAPELALHDALSLFEEDAPDSGSPRVYLLDPAAWADEDPLMGAIQEQLDLELETGAHTPPLAPPAPLTHFSYGSN